MAQAAATEELFLEEIVGLTSRRLESLKAAAALDYNCHINQAVAEKLCISQYTANNHLAVVRELFGCDDTFSAVCRALDMAFLQLDDLAGSHKLEGMLGVLSRREKEVLGVTYKEAVGGGSLSLEEVALKLGIAYRTVSTHVSNIYLKFRGVVPGVHNQAQLAVMAYYAHFHATASP